jgi:predicted GIY-YIG superfamily endonuclease
MTYVYFISNQRKTVVKIGIANDPTKRLKTFQTANHEKLIILKVIKVNNRTKAFELETALHQKFKKFHIRGEWFKLTRTVETFMENYQPNEPSIMEQWIVCLVNVVFLLAVVLVSIFILKVS